MGERQPDMLGGKDVPASRLKRGRGARLPVAREGWAARPGSGPEGETCGSCLHCDPRHFRKTYYKCAARPGDHWKGGRKTDIRPLDPACEKWAPTIARSAEIKAADRRKKDETDSVADGDQAATRARERSVSRTDVANRRDHADRGEKRPRDSEAGQAPRRSLVNLIDGKEPVQHVLDL
jgi:hypothetical protein